MIRDDDGRILLVKRSYGAHDWVLPGGNAEANESPIETVMREVWEETGLEVEVRTLAGVYYQRDHPAGEFLHFVFHCSAPDVTAVRTHPDEVEEHRFWPADALPAPMSAASTFRILDAVVHPAGRLPVTLPPRSGD